MLATAMDVDSGNTPAAIGPEPRHDCQVLTLRLSAEDYRQLEEAAHRAECPVEQFVHQAAFDQIARQAIARWRASWR